MIPLTASISFAFALLIFHKVGPSRILRIIGVIGWSLAAAWEAGIGAFRSNYRGWMAEADRIGGRK